MIMFPPWRFKLREAQVALEQGRLEEAAQIAGQPQLKPYLPVQQVLVQVGEQLARRATLRGAGAIWMRRVAWRAKRPTGSGCSRPWPTSPWARSCSIWKRAIFL